MFCKLSRNAELATWPLFLIGLRLLLQDNSNKFLNGLKQHLAILASEILLIYSKSHTCASGTFEEVSFASVQVTDKETQSPHPEIIELYYQIELNAFESNHLAILERLLSNRNLLIFRTTSNDQVVRSLPSDPALGPF